MRLYCPTPSKRRFATQEAADAAIKVEDLEPYRCECAEFHLRRVSKQRNTQARRNGYKPLVTQGWPYLPWEDEYILDNRNAPAAQIAQALGRSKTSVHARRKKLTH